MSLFDNQILSLFSLDVFRQIGASDQFSLCKLNLLTSMLMNNGIPYDISFVPGTRKEAAAVQLTIHINPTATLVFAIPLEPGSTVFGPSP